MRSESAIRHFDAPDHTGLFWHYSHQAVGLCWSTDLFTLHQVPHCPGWRGAVGSGGIGWRGPVHSSCQGAVSWRPWGPRIDCLGQWWCRRDPVRRPTHCYRRSGEMVLHLWPWCANSHSIYRSQGLRTIRSDCSLHHRNAHHQYSWTFRHQKDYRKVIQVIAGIWLIQLQLDSLYHPVLQLIQRFSHLCTVFSAIWFFDFSAIALSISFAIAAKSGKLWPSQSFQVQLYRRAWEFYLKWAASHFFQSAGTNRRDCHFQACHT